MPFTPHSYRVLQKDASPLEVCGYRYGATGLAYHEQCVHEMRCRSCRYERYIVDHLASGKMVPTAWFYTPGQAERFIMRIVQVADWNQSFEMLKTHLCISELQNAYWCVLRECCPFSSEYVDRWTCILLDTLDEQGNDFLPDSQRPCPLWREELFTYALACAKRTR